MFINPSNSADQDLIEIYNSSINNIDIFRSLNKLVVDKLSKDNIDGLQNNASVASPAGSATVNSAIYKQENRCHAFYRMLGLPIVDADGKNFFNPGYDSDLTKNEAKISISNSYLATEAYKRSIDRDNYLTKILDIFQKQDITSSVFVLSSAYKKNYADCIKNTDPLNFTAEDCSYEVRMTDNNSPPKNYKEYKYIDKTPVFDDLFNKEKGNKRYHYLLPLIPDPKICFAANSKKIVNVPFFRLKGPDCDPKIQYPAPGIQQVIIDRFTKGQSSVDLSDSQKETIENIENLSTKLADKLTSKQVDAINNASQKFINKNYYYNFIVFANKLMQNLYKYISQVESIQKEYHILPKPTSANPEAKCSSFMIYAKDPITLEKSKDKEIIRKTLEESAARISVLTKEMLNKTKDPINQANTYITAGIPSAQEDIVSKKEEEVTLVTLSGNRADAIDKMTTALQFIEQINGEFTGFGICDMYVIFSALYLVEDSVLISLLDDDAYSRASEPIFNLRLTGTRIPIKDALQKLTETIKNLYLIMDSIYIAIKSNSPSRI